MSASGGSGGDTRGGGSSWGDRGSRSFGGSQDTRPSGSRDLASAFGGRSDSRVSDAQWDRLEKELFGEVSAAGSCMLRDIS